MGSQIAESLTPGSSSSLSDSTLSDGSETIQSINFLLPQMRKNVVCFYIFIHFIDQGANVIELFMAIGYTFL